VDVELAWNADRYVKVVQPAVQRVAEQLKGRMEVLSGEVTWHRLAAAAKSNADAKKQYPQGALPRDTRQERYGLSYPPDQRVSALADLLPYLGKGAVRAKIDEKKAWYGKENIDQAAKWVPEFLVPYYPQTSWRATHPLAEGRSLGGTNYVFLSGLGLDAARYDPADPAVAKRLGMTGYEWGSKPSDVTDGLSNTAYMAQVPPGFNRPWIAGGGSTVMGVDDTLPNPNSDFVDTLPEKRGTHLLMADGSVRFVPQKVDPKIFKALVTRAGGESLADLDKVAPVEGGGQLEGGQLGGGPGLAGAKKPDGASANPAADAELDKLQGKWKVTRVLGLKLPDGKPIPPDALAKLDVRITGNRLVTSVAGQETDVSEITLDPTKTPKTIDVKVIRNVVNQKVGSVGYGVYELKDNKLVIRGGPEGSTERPKETAPPAKDSKDSYMELERAKD
jgi:uncharacterized protein (TIGR03067 family)